MKRNRFVIIGAGNIGRDLLEKMPRELDLLCVEKAPDAEERIRKVRQEGVAVLTGDATSRLVLEEAKVNEAEAVLITTTTEKINIEVARVLKEHFQPRRVIAVGITTQGIRTLTELGAEVLDIFVSSAASLRNMLEQKTKAAHSIGLGKNEILEVEVHPSSRLANKQLRWLAPLRWQIGVIYRDGNIVVPREDTVLKPRDRVVILGDPGALKIVSDILTFSFQQFPLEFGSAAVACLTGTEDSAFLAELDYLFSVFPLRRLFLVHSPRAEPRAGEFIASIDRARFKEVEVRKGDLPFSEAVRRIVHDEGVECGMIVLSPRALRAGRFLPARKRILLDLSAAAACPVLVARGTSPYEKVAVPVVGGGRAEHALGTALEIASSLSNEVTGLLVRPSEYIASDGDLKAYEADRKSVSEISLMYKTGVNLPVLTGNPVAAMLGALPGHNLVVIDTGALSRRSWLASLLDPDVLWHLIRRAPVSLLLIPPLEESL